MLVSDDRSHPIVPMLLLPIVRVQNVVVGDPLAMLSPHWRSTC